MPEPLSLDTADLLALGRLATRGVSGVTDVVEDVHSHVAFPCAQLRPPASTGFPTGIPSLVYNSIRAVTGLVDSSLAVAAEHASPSPRGRVSSGREALVATLNGVFGDYLEQTRNHLAISMAVRPHGKSIAMRRVALKAAFPKPSERVLLLVHGLCMNDLQWKRERHDHGAALDRDLGYTPVYLHYNSGLHVSQNGRSLADLLEALLAQWPVPVKELSILGHSMGGLVARSACFYAAEARHGWLARLRRLVFLGSPHHGVPLERLGSFADEVLEMSPYSAPFARLGKIRSSGVTDMRYGNLVDADWLGRERFTASADSRAPLPLPAGVESYAIAAISAKKTQISDPDVIGDGLVPLNSALGRHRNSAMDLGLTESHTRICYGMNHWDLLSRRAVYETIRRWLD
ncbi:lipase family alpha/beta hydrolase [Candidatus Korobacter versatilis]|uniref:lipase family alpha/beta hydrolase n=1 Tax=Candidatus Korobacter versatilis TaxID=658062 RepID=UPI0002F133CC|nr:hypothetical protein [Candidatus Koribacter versatilis]